MTATLLDYDVTDDVVVKPDRFWIKWTVWIGVSLAVLIGALFIIFPGLHENVVAGTPTANRVAVIQAAADRKIQAEADQRAADAAYIQDLQRQVKESMQAYVANTDNTNGYSIWVLDVALIRVSSNKYDGMARMQLAGHSPRQVTIHVTADDQHVMWATEMGGMLPLWN